MSLFKRGAVYWSYFYVDGVRVQQSTGTANRRQAERIEQKFKTEANARRHQLVEEDPRMTFGDLAARFLANAGPRLYHLERLQVLLPYFSDIPVLRITKAMTADYRHRRKSQNEVTDATVNRDLGVLRHILYWGVDESLLVSNPLARLRLARERRTRRRVMSVAEEQTLLAAASAHLEPIVIAALDTGMRRGELLNQLWEDLDSSRRLLYVTRSKTPEGECREIPLTGRLFALLASMQRAEGHVFLYKERPIRNISKGWNRALARAGLRHIRFHDLRHTFNTRLMEAGVMQEVRMALMGHANPQRVHSTYTHVELPLKRTAIQRLEQWVQQQQQLTGGQDDKSETN